MLKLSVLKPPRCMRRNASGRHFNAIICDTLTDKAHLSAVPCTLPQPRLSTLLISLWPHQSVIVNVSDCIRRVQPTRCNVSQYIYFCKTLYMFQTGLPSIISSSKLHIQRQVFVRPLLLPAASLEMQFHPGQANSR